MRVIFRTGVESFENSRCFFTVNAEFSTFSTEFSTFLNYMPVEKVISETNT